MYPGECLPEHHDLLRQLIDELPEPAMPPVAVSTQTVPQKDLNAHPGFVGFPGQ